MSDAALAKDMLVKQREYTYKDYLALDDGRRYELIDGVIYNMAAPSDGHQAILGELYYQFRGYLRGKRCFVRIAPYDVKLDDRNVVQPDLAVVCDRTKKNERGCFGAPDLVVEAVSPSSINRDNLTKLNLYTKAGVREYWLVYPDEKAILIYHNDENNKGWGTYSLEDKEVPIGILPGFSINLEPLFDYDSIDAETATEDDSQEATN
jgi:Uma2 family endonuclease